ncbi:MAG: c-type cytochrome, partial [Myxococcales bacterium]|nr:c-type cytochrome [Myxococcales bacterium]
AYRPLFAAAFPDDAAPISAENVAKALAAFQRSFVSNRAPYDQYVAGDENALSKDQKAGMQLFADGGCASCHVPPLFESGRYEQRVEGGDIGREHVTGVAADRGRLRVPTLRNLRETGPYFHDGSTVTLEDAVLREAATSAARGEGRALDADEAALVSVFLRKSLMDRTREPSRPDHVPSGLAVPKDGFRIPR